MLVTKENREEIAKEIIEKIRSYNAAEGKLMCEEDSNQSLEVILQDYAIVNKNGKAITLGTDWHMFSAMMSKYQESIHYAICGYYWDKDFKKFVKC